MKLREQRHQEQSKSENTSIERQNQGKKFQGTCKATDWREWRAEYTDQVFPRFRSPTAPDTSGFPSSFPL
jgi:hypothetical protein